MERIDESVDGVNETVVKPRDVVMLTGNITSVVHLFLAVIA